MLTATHFIHEHCGIIHTDIKPSNFLLSLPYKKLEAILMEKFEKKNNFNDYRAKEIKRNIQLEATKEEYNNKNEKLSRRERKRLRRKMKKMEKKIKKKSQHHMKMIKEQNPAPEEVVVDDRQGLGSVQRNLKLENYEKVQTKILQDRRHKSLEDSINVSILTQEFEQLGQNSIRSSQSHESKSGIIFVSKKKNSSDS